ncbi:amidohydrolase [Prosthecobacter sp.]|uniref:amidohydrolase n=1 Tax=Prosthecobacter sp. TaxID=1965333 RepID=UPI002ABA98D3|nr:amidohydrolase [Prosthecobacter sp.]MDZ4402972.1 amidohydrolase [Prosthecobacter sp.]
MKLTVLLAVFAFTSLHAAPSLILHHGKVITVDQAFRIAEAVAIDANGRITAVGTNDEVLALKADSTQLLDLGGKTLLPGLMDSHVHPGAAMTEFDHEIPTMETIADVLAYIATRVKASQPGELILVRQIFITRLEEKRYPTRAELDRIAPNNPVVFSTGPDSMLNSLALKLGGYSRDFKVPEGSAGKMETDPATGEPTGLLRSLGHNVKAPSSAKSPTADDTYRRTVELFRDYNAVGLTTVADRDSSLKSVENYEKMLAKGDLTVRMRVSPGIPSMSLWPACEKAIDEVVQHPRTKPDPMLQITGTKVYLDGGMLTGSAWMIDPWGISEAYGISDPQYRGVQKITADRLKQLVEKVTAAGLQFTAHSVGDAAVQLLIDTYEDVNQRHSVRAARSSVTHCNFMHPDSIAKAAKLGVCIDLQPIWLHMDGRTLTHHFGDERMARFQPLRACFDQKVIVGGGSDHMQKIGSFRSINPYNPWLGMWTAITRKARKLDKPVHIENALTREEALRLYTTNNAFLLKNEQHTGSLETGKLADMILIDRDPLTCPIDDLVQTQVLKTWLGGKIVFEKH